MALDFLTDRIRTSLLSLLQRAADPVAVIGQVQSYARAVGGVARHFILDAGGLPQQMTGPGAKLDTDTLTQMAVNSLTASTISIATGRCRSSDDTFDIIDGGGVVDITASGVNGLDVGVEASDTWYYVYIIADSTGVSPVAGLLSLSSVAPTLPAGYDKFRRIGSIRNDSASDIIPFMQNTSGRLRRVDYLEDFANLAVLTGGGALVRTNVSCAAFVPPTTDFAVVQCQTNPSSAADFFAGTLGSRIRMCGTDQALFCLIPLDTMQQVAYQNASAGGATNIWVLGYREVV